MMVLSVVLLVNALMMLPSNDVSELLLEDDELLLEEEDELLEEEDELLLEESVLSAEMPLLMMELSAGTWSESPGSAKRGAAMARNATKEKMVFFMVMDD